MGVDVVEVVTNTREARNDVALELTDGIGVDAMFQWLREEYSKDLDNLESQLREILVQALEEKMEDMDEFISLYEDTFQPVYVGDLDVRYEFREG
tara:strand:+ start:569 stop:853 length:285 start_codon:yes stop_codon:yes gene_type:complete